MKLSGPMALVLSVVAVVVVVLLGWFALVSPQRSKATKLDAQISTVETQLSDDEALLNTANKAKTHAALVAAERALPETPETSAILRQLSAVVASSQVELDSIGPGGIATTGGAQPYPLSLTVKGRYFALQKFMRLLRQSADVQGDKITGKGRLYSVDGITFGGSGASPSGGNTGLISASISLNAYTYGTPPASPPPSTTTTTDTTTTAAGATG